MSSKKLYIIGTMHLDPDGSEQLDHAFSTLSPRIIGLESSKARKGWYDSVTENEADDYFEDFWNSGDFSSLKQYKSFARRFMVENMKLGDFEHKVAHSYVTSHADSSLVPIDMPFPGTREELIRGGIEFNLVDSENQDLDQIRKLLDGGLDAYLGMLRRVAEHFYDRQDTLTMFLTLTMHLSKEPGLREAYDVLKKFEDIPVPSDLSIPAQKVFSFMYSSQRNDEMSRNIRNAYTSLEDGNMVVPVGSFHAPHLGYRLHDLSPNLSTLADWKK